MSKRPGRFTEEEVELANLIWEECRERELLLDSRGRPSYILALNLARHLLRKAYDIGLTDPLATIDWRAIIDCELEYGELLSEFERWLNDHFGRTRDMSEISYSNLDMLRLDIEAVKDAIRRLEEASPDELREAGLSEEDRQRQLEELRSNLEKLEAELKRLEAKKMRIMRARRGVRAPEREKTKTLIEYAVKKPETRLGRFIRRTTLFEYYRPPEKPPEKPPEVKPPEKPPPPPPPPPSPPRRRMIKDAMSYDEFVNKIKSYLSYQGIIPEVLSELVKEIEQDLRRDYEEASVFEIDDIVSRIIIYFVNEYLPQRFTIIPSGLLAGKGVRVDHPKKILIYGVWSRPRIHFLKPRFDLWVSDCIKVGMTVKQKPVSIVPGKTHLIIDPVVPLEKALVAIREDTIFLVNALAIGYVFDPDAKYVEYYYYPACVLIGRVKT